MFIHFWHTLTFQISINSIRNIQNIMDEINSEIDDR